MNSNHVEYLSDDEDYYNAYEPASVDFELKVVAVRASRAVVRVDYNTDHASENDDGELRAPRASSGTVISCEKGDGDGVWIATILTCATFTADPEVQKVMVCWEDGVDFEAKVDAFDIHYNVALLKVYLESPVPIAIQRSLDVVDSTSSPIMSRHSTLRKIHLGDGVVALARAFDARASLVASFGEFSGSRKLEVHGLLWSTCELSPAKLGGPLINGDGEVIGVNFRKGSFLPINIISRCLGCLKKHEKVNHPRLGMRLTSVHEAALETLKEVNLKFPDISAGVVVEEVEKGSFADQSGILPLDVIVCCDEIIVTDCLKLFELFWDKTQEKVELIVKRASVGDTISLSMIVAEASPDDFDSWPTDVWLCLPHEPFSSRANRSLDYYHVGLDSVRRCCLDEIGESIVQIASFRGEKSFFDCSGIMFHCGELDDLYAVSIVTSACLLGDSSEDISSASYVTMVKVILFDGRIFVAEVSAFDFHYNLAILVIKSRDQLPTVLLKSDHASHSKGERVTSLGRCSQSNRLLAADGVLSNERCHLDCEELCKSTCNNSTVYIGGPLINDDGEVLGINFYASWGTPFLPINIVLGCLDQLKNFGRVRHPWIGARIINLQRAAVGRLERIIHKFGEISKGVMVDKVVIESPAHIAGLFPSDVIFQFGQEVIGCSMQFNEIMFDKAGEDVEVIVIRSWEDAPLTLTLHVAEEIPYVNSWPLHSRYRRKRQRAQI